MSKTLLNGIWKLSGENAGNKINCEASIPGDFHSALLNANIIPDPYYGFNEQKVLWVGKTDWTIVRDFEYSKISGKKAILEMTEADTFFTVYINNKAAGNGHNQFARHRFDITDLVENGKNTIKILFESAERKAVEIAKDLPYPVPYSKYDVYSPDRNMVRKCQCHGGWDWGPCLMVSGIYSDIFIETVNDGLFDSIRLDYSHENQNWKVDLTIDYSSFENKNQNFTYKLSGPDIKTVEGRICQALIAGKNEIKTSFNVINPFVWKTSGELKELGLKENTAYELTVTSEEGLQITKKIYFSSLKLISEKDNDEGKPGRSIYFENNDRKIYAKGSNWIPCESLPSRMTNARYENLLTSAFEANENCIRVWGGGFYEKDVFYDLCDKLGIIIWQDCMFACSLYPMTKDFINQVNFELDYQIPRLQSHACIGIWCGNNENFGALKWYSESNNNLIRYLVDYDRLTNGIVGKKIKEIDPKRMFWPSSPCAGPDDYGDNWHSDNIGDMHFWSVWHERKSFDAYQSIRPRFVSEFGYESFPSIETINSFAQKEDFNFTSSLMEYHQRSPNGNSIILENFSRYFKFPVGFENMIYLSQVQQALAIKTAVEWWHSLKPHCMGSIIWQLNDIWPGPSWSSLEYNGKWKLMHYAQKRFFANVSIPLFEKDGKLHAIVCNDTAEQITGELKLDFLKFDGTEYKASKIIRITLDCDTTKEFFTEDIDKENSTKFFVYATLNAASKTKEYNCENTSFVDLYKHCNITKAVIQSQITKTSTGFEISLQSDKPAFFVGLDTTKCKGIFSDNMITLLPGITKKLTFRQKDKSSDYSLSDFTQDISIKSLCDTY